MVSLRRVVVAVSGGVDSAVSALALKKKGFDVCGVFMNNWDVAEEGGECTVRKDEEDARFVCRALDIPFREVSFVKDYWNEVFTYVIESYQKGLTPNPDIMCNKKIKFDLFFNYAVRELGADAVATGHYARTSFGCFLEKFQSSGRVSLLKAVDPVKDQTFFLSQVSQEALRRTMFPVGELMKSTVKRIAAENGLRRIADRAESMGMCFIGTRKFSQFIGNYVPPRPGNLVNVSTGRVEGAHTGRHLMVCGQRVKVSGLDRARYVVSKHRGHDVLVGAGLEHPALWSHFLVTGAPHWIRISPEEWFDCDFLFQHVKTAVRCRVVALHSGLLVVLQKPLSQMNPGQFAVFYDGHECLGSAEIIRVGPSFFSLGKSLPPGYREYYDDRENLDIFQ